MKKLLVFTMILTVVVSGCYYDNYENLHAKSANGGGSCDTTSTISYAQTIVPILQSNCGATDNACHTTSAAGGGYILDTWAKVAADSVPIMATIAHDPNYSFMPKGGGMLPACEAGKIRHWYSMGAPNN